MIRFLVSACLLMGLSACSTLTPPSNYPVSEEIRQLDKAPVLGKDDRSDELSLVLTFSGGGTRAAAFSYGVLKALHEIKPASLQGKNLLGEVDVISSVSGGSFTAAYYGLYGNKIFTDYERDFLKRQVQSNLIKYWLLNPRNWIRLTPAAFNRSDLAAEYYTNTIFGRKTFADLLPHSPLIIINATDLGTGTGISFTYDDFRWICSDIERFPIGRAVAASSAVPVVFSPIAVKNFGGTCKPYVYQKTKLRSAASRIDVQAFGLRKYKDASRYRYLHLVDGGVADNLGVRSLLRAVSEQDNNIWKMLKAYDLHTTKKMAFVVVNAADSILPTIPKQRKEPGIVDTLGAFTTIQSTRYNEDTLDLLQSLFPIWQKQVREGRCAETQMKDCGDIKFYLAELNFNQLPKKSRDELALLATSLQLPAESVDKLIETGKTLLRQSPEFKALLSDLGEGIRY